MYLRELNQAVSTVHGIGTVRAAALAGIGITTVSDLLVHIPREYEDRVTQRPLADARPDVPVNTVVTVRSHAYFPWRNRKALKVIVEDGSGEGSLVCFGRNFLARTLVPGRRFYLFGVFERRFGELQAVTFDVERADRTPHRFNVILPVYSLTGKLTQTFFRNTISALIRTHAGQLSDEIPSHLRAKRGLQSAADAIQSIHFPASLDKADLARRTLAYSELFYFVTVLRRRYVKLQTPARPAHRVRSGKAALYQALLKRLPFHLTDDQRSVVEEIKRDLLDERPMSRLLQGDVGCGKTLVAFFSALFCVENGEQVAIMAPTELLARQHADTAAQLLEPIGVRVAYLSGNVDTSARRRVLSALKDGEIDVLIGTHALFSGDPSFRKLGMVIIDEQHRFGVVQRVALIEKGDSPDLLLMTATPIPRTLSLTLFADLDISTIRSMPPGRTPVQTHLAKRGRETKVYEWVRRELAHHHQAYFVYPVISRSEALDVKDAESMARTLAADVFPDNTVRLLHSRLPDDEKTRIMSDFSAGRVDVLVATSVVEVGVDVPNATCMIVEHAERFGLAALHQLRGRVGRSSLQSYAFFVYDEPLTEDAKERLKVLKSTADGFKIAEADMRIRGPGHITGSKQSGSMELRFAELSRDSELLSAAADDARALIQADPGLIAPESAVVRDVLSTAPPFEDHLLAGG